MIYVYICIYIYNIYIYIYIYNQLVAKTVRWGRSALMDPKLPSLDGRMLGWTGCILRHWHNRVVLSATVDSTFCIFFLIWKAESGAGVGGGIIPRDGVWWRATPSLSDQDRRSRCVHVESLLFWISTVLKLYCFESLLFWSCMLLAHLCPVVW